MVFSLCLYLHQEIKEITKDMDKTLDRTLLDGRKYRFVEWMIFGHPTVTSYSEWDGRFHHIGLKFNTLEEAAKWCDDIDYKETHPEPVKHYEFTVPDDYYGVAGRYYGD